MLQEMVRDCRHTTGDGQRLQTYYRRWSETADIYRRWSETADMVQETVRDCRHSTGDGQRLKTYYRRRSETADMVQEMVRDCRHSTGDGQGLCILCNLSCHKTSRAGAAQSMCKGMLGIPSPSTLNTVIHLKILSVQPEIEMGVGGIPTGVGEDSAGSQCEEFIPAHQHSAATGN